MANIELIKQLRDETEISIGECKKALEAAAGDINKAKGLLREWGKNVATKKGDRATGQGKIEAYVHATGKVGVMIELRCETDFVAKSEDFKNLAHELCLQFTAMGCDQATLMSSPWIKNPSKTVKDLVDEVIAKVGENIVVKNVVRFEL
jgi:elongation factor Ts